MGWWSYYAGTSAIPLIGWFEKSPFHHQYRDETGNQIFPQYYLGNCACITTAQLFP